MSHRSGETEDATIADLAVGDVDGPDQDRLGIAERPHGEIQPIAANRRAIGRRGAIRGAFT